MVYDQISAIVLTRVSSQHDSLSLLTPEFGRILVHDARRYRTRVPLSPGSLVYVSLKKGATWHVTDARSELFPISDSAYTLFWHHHLLELTHYCTLRDHPDYDLFELLWMTMCVQEAPQDFWSAAVLMLFARVGYDVPKEFQGELDHFSSISKKYFDGHHGEGGSGITRKNIPYISTGQNMIDLNMWIIETLRSHPYYTALKTTQFFTLLYPEAQVNP